MTQKVTQKIQVIVTPEGLDPLSIRSAWCGRVMPLIGDEKILQGSPPELGVYNGPNPDKYGYIVAVSTAVEVLRKDGQGEAANFLQETAAAANRWMLHLKCADCQLIS